MRWLVSRKAYDSLLVALDGPDKLELEEIAAPIVGYAVLRQERVIELFTTPGHPTANYQLLARACGDAIEHDRQDLILNAPPLHPLHRLVCAAGGVHHNQEAEHGEVYMANIVDPLKFLMAIGPELETCAKAASIPREAELGLQVDNASWRLIYTRRGFRVRSGKVGRNHLKLGLAEFTRLVLGHGQVREAAFAGRVQPSTLRGTRLGRSSVSQSAALALDLGRPAGVNAHDASRRLTALPAGLRRWRFFAGAFAVCRGAFHVAVAAAVAGNWRSWKGCSFSSMQ